MHPRPPPTPPPPPTDPPSLPPAPTIWLSEGANSTLRTSRPTLSVPSRWPGVPAGVTPKATC